MYKVASDKRQTALRRGRLADWVDGGEPHVETRTIHEQYHDLKTAIQSLEAHYHKIPKDSEHSKERRQIGLKLARLQEDLSPLHKAVKADNLKKNGIADYFVNVAREQLYPAQFKAMWAAAARLQEQDRARAEQWDAESEKALGDPEKLIAETERVIAEAEKIAATSKGAQKGDGDPGSSAVST